MNAPTDTASSTGRPAYGMPATSYPVRLPRHTSHMRLLVALSITMVAVIAASVLIAWLFTPKPAVNDCPYAGCGKAPTAPPVGTPPGGPVEPSAGSGGSATTAEISDPHPFAGPGKPVQNYSRFTAADKSWSVAYPPGIRPPDADSTEIGWKWSNKAPEGLAGGGVLVFGQKARARTSQDIVKSLLERNFPGSAIELPDSQRDGRLSTRLRRDP